MGDLQRDVPWTIEREGGDRVTNYSWDPGGLTKYGIAQRSHPKVNIRALTLAQASEIYQNEYWGPAGCEALAEPLALNVFDLAVNAGVPRARALLSVPALIVPTVVDSYLWARAGFYTELAARHPEKAVSLAGWLRRVILARAESARRAA